VKHLAAITEPAEIGALLRAIAAYRGSLITRCALRLAPLVFVRPGEPRNAEWSEIDLDRAEWCIPAERMKMREPHIVPLSSQAVAILREFHPLTGIGRFVFPSPRAASRPMSNNAVLSALRHMGYSNDEMTGHGFRSMASTLLNEQGWHRDAYNYAEHLPERRRMMQAWADYLDGLKNGAEVIPFRHQGAN
jgi:integrase